MEITTELINHLAELSHLEFSEVELENFKLEFQKTLIQMAKLESIDTSKLEKISGVLDAEFDLTEDEQKQGLSKNEAIKNAPETMGSSISVPMMVD